MSNIKKKRLFIALNLPAETKEAISNFVDNIRENWGGIRWISSLGLHITLHFLGEMTFEDEEEVRLSLQSLDYQFKELEFEIVKLGVFPNMNRPRIVYLACRQTNGNSIEKLQELIGFNFVKLGIKIDEKKWKPHITIGRANGQIKASLPGEFEKIKFKATTFDLMEAFLKTTGAEYKKLASYKFSE